MSAPFSSIWNSAASLGIAKPSASDLVLLVLLAASLLALRALRERHFKIWVLGWTALVLSGLAEHSFSAKMPAPFDLLAAQTTFILAIGLLAGGILLYSNSKDLLLPLMVITPVLVGFAGARVLLWPDSLPLRMALEVGYRLDTDYGLDCLVARPSRAVGAAAMDRRPLASSSSPFMVTVHGPHPRMG